MRTVDQARLGFREGNSDKVYEVDLVEVAAGQYVVNFRYGRRGTALRDGTKTPLPISLDKARTLFTALVAEKRKGGYQPLATGDAARPAPTPPSAQEEADRASRSARVLLTRLGEGHRSAIPLHLVVRRVGERGLTEAEPLLLELLASGSPPGPIKPEVFRHLVIAALARCGGARSVAPLKAVVENTRESRPLRNVARLALVMVGGEAERRRARADVPKELRPETTRDPSAMVQVAEQMFAETPHQARSAIFDLYISSPLVPTDQESELERLARRTVLSLARTARMFGQELGLLRTLNWAAEIRRDGELFALLARRFESRSRGAKPDTLNYFRRRAARVLRRLGSIGSPDYVKLATELLVLYREEDAEPLRSSAFGRWDAFARYHSLGFVLWGNSSRYAPANHRRATWRCRGDYQPGQQAPTAREESYPALWDKAPAALWRLGSSDTAGVIVQFATRALRDNPAYLSQVEDAALAVAMARTQRPMRQLAFEVARLRPLNGVLARGALNSDLEEADRWVLEWVEHHPGLLTRDTEMLALLITARSPLVREAAKDLTRDSILEEAAARGLVSLAIATLMQLSLEPGANERAASAAAYLLERVPRELESLSGAVLRDLLAHELAAVAEFGGGIGTAALASGHA